MNREGGGKRETGGVQREKHLVWACFGNALWMVGKFDLRSQILTYPSLPQLARVWLDPFDVACRLTERMEAVPPGWPPKVVRCRRSVLA